MKIFHLKSIRGGYTLIEMTVVLFIILAFLAMSIPFFANSSLSTGLNTSVREVGTILRTARSYAISHNENYEAVFDNTVTPNAYSIRRSAAAATPIDKTYLLPRGVTFTAVSTVDFTSNGGLDANSPSNSVTITAKGKNKQVTVDAPTGAVTIPQ